jgi:hypothetical protein
MTRILFIGQKPETVDFSDPALPPGFDAEKINAGIAVAVAKIAERGWQGDTCMIMPDETAATMIETQLSSAHYDCVVIGGGLRIPPKSLALFERVVNAVHKAAPHAAIAFNTRRVKWRLVDRANRAKVIFIFTKKEPLSFTRPSPAPRAGTGSRARPSPP